MELRHPVALGEHQDEETIESAQVRSDHSQRVFGGVILWQLGPRDVDCGSRKFGFARDRGPQEFLLRGEMAVEAAGAGGQPDLLLDHRDRGAFEPVFDEQVERRVEDPVSSLAAASAVSVRSVMRSIVPSIRSNARICLQFRRRCARVRYGDNRDRITGSPNTLRREKSASCHRASSSRRNCRPASRCTAHWWHKGSTGLGAPPLAIEVASERTQCVVDRTKSATRWLCATESSTAPSW